MASVSMDEIDQQESACFLDAFNADVAFELGCRLRELARTYDHPALIQIKSASGLVYFQACSRPGVITDNQSWIDRKFNTVMRFYRSSYYIGSRLRSENRDMMTAFKLSETEYSAQGGGFPIRVRGTEGVQAVIVVSGLRPYEDHDICYRVLKEFASGDM